MNNFHPPFSFAFITNLQGKLAVIKAYLRINQKIRRTKMQIFIARLILLAAGMIYFYGANLKLQPGMLTQSVLSEQRDRWNRKV